MKLASILGLNARGGIFSSHGSDAQRGKKISRSKILTKRFLRKAGVPTPKTYKIFRTFEDVENFPWSKLPESFALKPSKGMGGQGIIVVRKKSSDGGAWVTTNRKKVTIEDLKLHTHDVLEGAYSIGNVPDVAFCEEYVGRHKAFRKYAYRGTADVRVIVYNKVPVMAMLRLPTPASSGRANLHQGAIGVGVDIETGVTTHAIWYGETILYKPGTTTKLSGIKIPGWNQILEIASKTQIESGLDYIGVDIVLHPEKGPMVLEINSQPGLQIQLANMAGLRKRLERVEDLKVLDAEHGVKIAKALFSLHLPKKTKDNERPVVTARELMTIRANDGKKHKVDAKIDTGAWRTAIDREFAKSLGLLEANNIIEKRVVRSALGQEERPVINLTFWLKGKKITTLAGVTDRRNLKRKVIVGRRDLSGFLIEPEVKK